MKQFIGLVGSLALMLGTGVFCGGAVMQMLGFGRRITTMGAAVVLFGLTLVFVASS